jgi:hypothetical protein
MGSAVFCCVRACVRLCVVVFSLSLSLCVCVCVSILNTQYQCTYVHEHECNYTSDNGPVPAESVCHPGNSAAASAKRVDHIATRYLWLYEEELQRACSLFSCGCIISCRSSNSSQPLVSLVDGTRDRRPLFPYSLAASASHPRLLTLLGWRGSGGLLAEIHTNTYILRER